MAASYRLFLRTQLSRGRVAGLAAMALLVLLVGLAVRLAPDADPSDAGFQVVNTLGLALTVPVGTLVLASAVLGDPNEDGTLVYLWLRPLARWRIVLAAVLATLTVLLPLVVAPLVGAAAISGGGADLVGATAVAALVGTAAYAGLFLLLGLRVKRALLWGLGYVLLWEGTLGGLDTGIGRLAVHTYTDTLLDRLTDGEGRVSTAAAIAVPLLAGIVAVLLTVRRLRRQDVT